jgi:dipeptidyl aminopeptidase/acylaminoacyl peptidase
MKIHEITYLVDGLKIKGYLGLPDGILLSTGDIAEEVQCALHAPSPLPVLPVECTGHTGVTDDLKKTTIFANKPTYPALLYCRGGINSVGMPRLEWIHAFCLLGFVVFAPWYRGTLRTDGRDEFGGADKADSIAGFRILYSLSFVDAACITVLGFSRGSINATQTAVAEASCAGLILWGGVSDLAATYEERVDLRRMLRRVVGGTPRKVPWQYAERAPIKLVNRLSCRTLVIHSTHDPQVAFHHGEDMYHALLQAGIPAEWHGYQGYAHHFHPEVRQAVIERMLQWTLS